MKISKINLTMTQLVNVILAIEKVHTAPQSPGLYANLNRP